MRVRLVSDAALSVVVGFLLGPLVLLLALGTTAAIALGAFPRNPISLVASVAFDLYASYMAYDFVRSLFRFSSVEVEADGSWRLIGPLGNTVGRIPAGQPRRVRGERTVFMTVAPNPQHIRSAFIEIESGSRRHRSWRIPASQLDDAMAKLPA